MMHGRRGTSSGGGASSLGYLFGSDATTLARPNNRAPPRPQQPQENISNSSNINNNSWDSNHDSNRESNMYTGLSNSKHEEFEHDATGYEKPTGYETPSGYQTPSGYHTPGTDSSDGNRYSGSPGAAGAGAARHYLPQTRAAGKVINDGGGVSLDMSGGSFMGGNNNYFRADGQNSGNFITGQPSTRVRAAPGGCSSLGYLFGGA